MSLRSGTWLLATALGLVFTGFVSRAQAEEKATATGTWKWEWKRRNGDAVVITLKLKQAGEKLTGTISGPGGHETAIQDGTVKDGEVSFQVIRERNGNTFTRKYNGKRSGDTIKGKVEMEFDGNTRTRDWEAKRA